MTTYFCTTDFYDKGGYVSYQDFFRLAKLAGYPIIPVSAINPDDKDNTYIFTPANGETVKGWPHAKAQIILWQLEWMLTDEHNTPPGVKRVWASDKWFADRKGFEYVPIGGHHNLSAHAALGPCPKKFDVALLAYQTPRRQYITMQLDRLGVTHDKPEGLIDKERSYSLYCSKAMMHVHQHPHIPGIAPLRWALAAAYNLPMISETVADEGIFKGAMMSADFDFLPAFAAVVTKDKIMLQEYAAKLYDLLCVQHTFEKIVEYCL